MSSELEKNRIRELDFARGVALTVMAVLHAISFAQMFAGFKFEWPGFLYAVMHYGGAFFVVLSGICASLGGNSVKRGLVILVCAFSLTAVTEWLYLSGREGNGVLIQWGVLHLIGFCKLVWPLLKKLPAAALLAAGAVTVTVGYVLLSEVRVANPYLFVLGLQTRFNFCFDYFPILPHLGWFMIGGGLGKIIYKEKKPLFPDFGERLFSWIGKYSLPIYMAHFPLLYLIFKLV